jgi:hypothetical protein
VSRLSERNPNIAADIDLPIGVTKKSKFFAKAKRSPIKPVQLNWESSQEPISIDIDEEPLAVEPPRSPSSACDSPASLPRPVDADIEESFNHLTSPAAPNFSSPAVSSPPHGETFTSPRPKRDTLSRSLSPISPTRPGKHTSAPNVLIPSTSQIPHGPVSSSAPNRLQAGPGLGTSTYSNFDSSSDTLDPDEVVTPSFEVASRTATSVKRSRVMEDEVDEVELEEREVRAEKAKVISHDWRLKYAFGANHVSNHYLEVMKLIAVTDDTACSSCCTCSLQIG